MLHGLKPLMEIEPPALFGEACLVGEDVPEAARRPFTCRAMSCCMLWQVKPAFSDGTLLLRQDLPECH